MADNRRGVTEDTDENAAEAVLLLDIGNFRHRMRMNSEFGKVAQVKIKSTCMNVRQVEKLKLKSEVCYSTVQGTY